MDPAQSIRDTEEQGIDLLPFLEALFPDTDFTKPEDAQAAAAWVLDNRQQFAEALKAYVEQGGAQEPPPEDLESLL